MDPRDLAYLCDTWLVRTVYTDGFGHGRSNERMRYLVKLNSDPAAMPVGQCAAEAIKRYLLAKGVKL